MMSARTFRLLSATATITGLAASAIAGPPVDFPQSRLAVRTAMEHVESSGNPNAVNVKEDAVGILQIRPIMVEEVNRLQRLKGHHAEMFTLDDRYSIEKSREMFTIYTDFWCARRENWTQEYIARIWNGGPAGHRNQEATTAYWHKVKVQMARSRED